MRKIKMVAYHATLFVWLVRHTLHKGRRFDFNCQLDHVEAEKDITTISRCLHCGKTLKFVIPKSSQK
jgi:hypothetical protein